MEHPTELATMVRWALRHLYDPNALRASPLVRLLGLQDSLDPAKRLREKLVAAIEALEPGKDVPEHAKVWRIYEVLLYRYVQQSAQKEIASQLGIGVRHLRREEAEAIDALAYTLAQAAGIPSDPQDRGKAAHLPVASGSEGGRALTGSGPCVSSLANTLPGVLTTVTPLAERYRTRLLESSHEDLGGVRVCVDAVHLRQILINLLTVAIRQTPLGMVALEAQALEATVRIRVRGQGRLQEVASDTDDSANLGLAGELVRAAGGALQLSLPGEPFDATVTLPAVGAVTVLAIDDHADALSLFQRYADHTRFRVLPLAQPQRAIEVARERRPDCIVLDVMMPSEDGWELMGRLKQHPDTRHIPLLVCTILAQEELALSLGAAGFLHKPVSRRSFLSALERLVL